MWHMPYERMAVEDEADDTPDTLASRQASTPSEEPELEAPQYGEPGRTPGSAEAGAEEQERRMPLGEPGRTPGSAEGEDDEQPSRH